MRFSVIIKAVSSFSLSFLGVWVISLAMIVVRAGLIRGLNFRSDRDWGSPHIRVLDERQTRSECDLFPADFETEDWMEPGEASLRSSAKARIERAMDCVFGASVSVRYFFGDQSLLVVCGLVDGGWCLEGEEEKQFRPETIWRPIRDVVLGAFGLRKPSSPPPWVAKRIAGPEVGQH